MFALKPRTILLLVISAIFCNTITAQVSCIPVFVKEYTGAGDIMPAAVRSLPDGTFILAGKGNQVAGAVYDGLVTRMSASGNVIWSYLIGGAGQDAFTGVTPLSDGSFLLYGTTGSFGYTDSKAWLVRIDNGGNLIWSRQLGNGASGNDRLKAVQQFSDGDIIGTYNANDSTAASDAVVFKMGIDGTLRWAHIFDQGNNDSFTSIAFTGSTIYAAGFYTIGTRRAVITKLNSTDGSLISSKNLFIGNTTYDHEIFNLEIFNNSISYGIYYRFPFNNMTGYSHGLVMVRTDLAENTQWQLLSDVQEDTVLTIPKRMADNGFLVLRGTRGTYGPPTVVKVNQFGESAFQTLLVSFVITDTHNAMDETNDGGCISVGYYKGYNTPYIMSVTRVNESGEGADCQGGGGGISTATTTFSQQSFIWAVSNDYIPVVNSVSTPGEVAVLSTQTAKCETSFCTDKTPLPPGCNKTYHLQFAAGVAMTLRDAVTTPDGGKIAVGDERLDGNGVAIKYNANGDVAWSKKYETFRYNTKFIRVLKCADGNYLIFANRNVVINSGSWDFTSVIKVDINGNVLWDRNINEPSGGRVTDAAATPNGGFVLLSTTGGFPSIVYFDANMNVIWKNAPYSNYNSYYQKVYYSNGALYFIFQSFYHCNTACFGAEKADLATGKVIWSNVYTAGGANSSGLTSKMLVNKDTAYVFLTHVVETPTYDRINTPVMVKINPNGSFNQGVFFQGANSVYTPFNGINYDINTLTADLTPNNDFVFSESVLSGADTVLYMARFGTDGAVKWAGYYPGTKNYYPLRVEAQGKGIVVLGDVKGRLARFNSGLFSSAFFIKTDSSGMIDPSGGCSRIDRPLSSTPIAFSVMPTGNKFQDVGNYVVTQRSISSADFPVDATLFCSTPANCNLVDLQQRAGGCSLKDTLVYYLANNAGCDAAAVWQYDTALFKTVSVDGDSLRIVPKKTGTFSITASIEGSCLTDTRNISGAVALAANTVALGNDAVICTGQQIKLSAGPGFATYKWNDNSTDSTLIATQPGKYYVDVTDNCGGTGTDTLLVNDAGLVFKITGNTTKCNNDTVQLQASAGYNNYQWTPQVNLQATNNTALVSPAATTKYYVTAEKWPGCALIDSILITTLTSPPVNLPNDVSICAGDSMMVQAAPGFNAYQWNTGETQSAIYVKSAGSFTVAATYSNGCQSKDTFRLLSLYPLPIPALDKSPVLCAGTTRVLQPKQLYSNYLWSDGSINQSMTVNTTGTYWVAVTDGHGCKGSDTARITTIAPLPADFLPADTAVCQYGKLTIVPKYDYRTYLWSDFSNSVELTIKKSGLYWLTVTDQNNCTGSDTIAIAAKDCMIGVYIPNAFTPNGDGKNDVFKPLIFGPVTSLTFIIYNRWGGRVYETHDPATGWDGKINGLSAQKGTYVWFCRYILEGQQEKAEKGVVELIQ